MSHHPDGTIINTWMYLQLVLFFSELFTLQIVVLKDKTKQTNKKNQSVIYQQKWETTKNWNLRRASYGETMSKS